MQIYFAYFVTLIQAIDTTCTSWTQIKFDEFKVE